jgi:hypothetical protein
MADAPGKDRGTPDFITCPSCTIQIPADVAVCPHCLRSVFRDKAAAPPKEIRQRLVPPERFPALRRYWGEYGKWLKVAAPVVLAALVLWVAYGLWAGLKLKVSSDNVFRIEASQEKSGRNLLLKGKLTNRGEDVPDLSLRSIGVIAEFRYEDGRTERRRYFPKSLYRGEGALMNGESGSFEFEVPKGVTAVSLRGEIVDLGEDRQFTPVGRGIPRAPEEKRR